MTFEIDEVVNKIKDLGYTNLQNLEILKKKNNYIIVFKKKLYNHKIYKFLLERKNLGIIDFEINEKLLLELINLSKKDFEKKLYKNHIINFKRNNIYNNKNKKLKRFLKRFYFSNILKNNNYKNIYIQKLKLRYITTSKFKKDLIDHIVSNNLDILYSHEIQHIMNFVNSNLKIKLHNIDSKKLFYFIKNSINNFYNVFSQNRINKLLILNISDNINSFANQINPYIHKYNILQFKNTNNKLFNIPFFTNFKNNSAKGFYYEDRYRDLYWDYNNSENWNISSWPNYILFKIDNNTKYYTLLSLYYDLILNNINKYVLLDIINENSSNSTKLKKKDFENMKISSLDFLMYCQYYYTYSLNFRLIFIICKKNIQFYKGTDYIIKQSYNPHCKFGIKNIIFRLKKEGFDNIII